MRYLPWLFCLLLLTACNKEPPAKPDTQAPEATTEAPWLGQQQALDSQVAEESSSRLRRLSVSANGFDDAINGLLGDPSDERLSTAQQAWSHLYQSFNEAYVVLVCRTTATPADMGRLQRADSFPILPGYIDSLKDWPDSGIVNDTTLPLTREGLLDQQGATMEGEASVGLQVIHFLLHGEPGAPRQAADLQPVTALSDDMVGKLEDQPNNRRRTYLQLATDLLVEDLLQLAREDKAPKKVTTECPVGAMRTTVDRLIQLDGLRGQTQVNQEYMADAVRVAASKGLQAALSPWLASDSRLPAWLDARLPGAAGTLPKALPPLDAKDRLQSLQSLHAVLSSELQALRQP